jgi:hypothetical protein
MGLSVHAPAFVIVQLLKADCFSVLLKIDTLF